MEGKAMVTLTRLLIYTMLIIIAFFVQVIDNYQQMLEKKEMWIVYKGPLQITKIEGLSTLFDSTLNGMLMFEGSTKLTISNCNIITDLNEFPYTLQFKKNKVNPAGNTVQKPDNSFAHDTSGRPLLVSDVFRQIPYQAP